MAGVYSGGSWIPFVDQMGRQGWYNQANGQTTYQMGQTYGGGYNANTMVPGQIPPVQPPMYPQPIPQVPMGYIPQPPMMPQMPQMPIMPQPQQQPQFPQRQPQPQMSVPLGWQPMFDRSGRRYYYNPTTGQSVYQF